MKINDIYSLQKEFMEQIHILLESLIVFLNPPLEKLANVLSKKNHHNMRLSGFIKATPL